jgi:hypothetical protein
VLGAKNPLQTMRWLLDPTAAAAVRLRLYCLCIAPLYRCTALLYHCTALLYHCTALLYHCTALLYHYTVLSDPWVCTGAAAAAASCGPVSLDCSCSINYFPRHFHVKNRRGKIWRSPRMSAGDIKSIFVD